MCPSKKEIRKHFNVILTADGVNLNLTYTFDISSLDFTPDEVNILNSSWSEAGSAATEHYSILRTNLPIRGGPEMFHFIPVDFYVKQNLKFQIIGTLSQQIQFQLVNKANEYSQLVGTLGFNLEFVKYLE